VIRKCCSKDAKFLSGNLPLLEAVFRFLLTRSNDPISLQEITNQVSNLKGTPVDGNMLQRLLDSDEFYGICLYIPTEAKEKKKR